MSTQKTAVTTLTAALARRIATAHPEATLPCPGCAASLKATNLDSHLSKVHTELPGSSALRISGVDKRSFVPLFGLFVVWIVAVLAAFVILKVQVTDSSVVVLGVTLLICLGLPGVAAAGVFRAHLELEGEQLRLRWLFGLASRKVVFPVELESGTAIESEMKHPGLSSVDGGARDAKLGAYLRLSSGGSSITLAAKKSSQLASNWAAGAWTRGKDRRWWDITVDRSELVALEYQLAARGQLTVRAEA